MVERDRCLIMVDDERMPLLAGEQIEPRWVRFRTFGCYPLTGAIESRRRRCRSRSARRFAAKTSERRSRVIDHDHDASMERKKRRDIFNARLCVTEGPRATFSAM